MKKPPNRTEQMRRNSPPRTMAVLLLAALAATSCANSGEVVVVDPRATRPPAAETDTGPPPDPEPDSTQRQDDPEPDSTQRQHAPGPDGAELQDGIQREAAAVVPLSGGSEGGTQGEGADDGRVEETNENTGAGGGPGGGPGSDDGGVGPVGITDVPPGAACVVVGDECVAVGGRFLAGYDIPGVPFDAGVRGGLVLLPERVRPAGFTHEVLDLCDDSVAFLVANERFLGPGEEPTQQELLQVAILRLRVDCDTEGGPRYIYMGNGRTSGGRPYATRQEALSNYVESQAKYADRNKQHPGGKLLGYGGHLSRQFPLEERDEVVVLADTVSVAGGAVRGLVHNLSETLYARNVTITARTPGSAEALSWLWPLTVQPGERAPFEIENWQGPQNPLEIAIEVTADLSPVLDISRSFDVYGSEATYEPPPEIGDNIVIRGFLRPPTSPPGLDELVMGQTIEDLRAYTAWLNADGAVTEVRQHRPHTTVYYGECCWNYVYADASVYPPPPDKLPDEIAARDDLRYAEYAHIGPRIFFVDKKREGDYQVWFGGANPPPNNQPGNNPDG